ncbi:hypothetical protein GGE65_004703 [Skermanella aerolata]|uniref:hypothetical protein n=1 Tax=Skermanella aerolata TaxID=393310 RepID=UPI003D1FC450
MTIANLLFSPDAKTAVLAINSEAVSPEGVKGACMEPKWRYHDGLKMLMGLSGDVRILSVFENAVRIGVEEGYMAATAFDGMKDWLAEMWHQLSADPDKAPASSEIVLFLAAPVDGRLRAVVYHVSDVGVQVIELAPGQCAQMPSIRELRGAEPGCHDGIRMLATLQRRLAPSYEGPTFPAAGELLLASLNVNGLTTETIPEAAWA